MGELSPTHWLIVLIVALVLFGGSRLPDVARGLGRSARILRAELSGTDHEASPGRPRRDAQPPDARPPDAQPPEDGGDTPASEDGSASGSTGSR